MPDAGPLERFAAEELRRCLYRMTAEDLPIKTGFDAAEPSIVVASQNSLEGLKPAPAPKDGFRVSTHKTPDAEHTLIIGDGPAATLQAVYSFLEERGAGFFTDGEFLPKTDCDFPGREFSRAPLFAVRGAMPLAEGAVSRRDWRLEDYFHYIDALAAMRCNLLFLNLDASEPFSTFAQYRCGGGPHNPEHPEFAFGTDKFFAAAEPSFEAALTRLPPDRAMACGLAALRAVLARAAERGLRVCFSMVGGGAGPHQRDIGMVLTQLENILRACPTLDYLCLRTRPVTDADRKKVEDGISPDSIYYREACKKDFPKLDYVERKLQAVPMTLFARAARQRIAALAPHVKLVVEALNDGLAEGFDRALDPGIIIASPVPLRQSGREWWRIIDGEENDILGLPASGAGPIIAACREAYENSASGVVLAHSRTAAVCEAADAFAHCCWSAEEAGDYYSGFARRRFGATLGAAVCGALPKLDELLCDRWQKSADSKWPVFDGPKVRDEIKAVRAKLLAAREAAIKAADFRPIADLDDVLHSIEWALAVDDVARLLANDLPTALKKKDAAALKALLTGCSPGWGVAHCAARVSCRDELIELREIIRGPLGEYRKAILVADALLGKSAFGLVGDDFTARKAFPFYPVAIQPLDVAVSAEAGREFFARVFIPHTGPLEAAELLYRRPGEREFVRVPLENAGGWEYRAKLKFAADHELVEYRIRAVTTRGEAVALPMGEDADTAAMSVAAASGYKLSILPGDVCAAKDKPYCLAIAVASSHQPPVEVALFYRIAGSRDFERVRMEGDGYGGFAAGIPAGAMGREGVEYYFEIADPAGGRLRRPGKGEITLRPDCSPPSKVAVPVLTQARSAVVLAWPDADDDRGVEYYEVRRRPIAAGGVGQWSVVGRAYFNEFIDPIPGDGKNEYKIVAVDFAGNRSDSGD